MEDYNKIIESLSVRFIKANNIRILKPVTIANFYDVENTVVILNKGSIRFGSDGESVKEGEVLFVPGGKSVSLTYGSGTPTTLTNDDFINNKEAYFQSFDQERGTMDESFSFINFEAKVFDSVNFFASLDLPPFVISGNNLITSLVKAVLTEDNSEKPGKGRIVKINTDYLVVEIIRHILSNGLFVEQLATNSTYFKDPTLD